MKKSLLLIIAVCVVAALAFGYVRVNSKAPDRDRAEDKIAWQHKTADEVKTMIDSGSNAIYLDIRVMENYMAGHLPSSLGVHAFPVDTPEQEDTLRAAEWQLADDIPIIVICESGSKASKRTISILTEDGIAKERLYILEGGAKGWPYPEILLSKELVTEDE